MAVHAAGWRRGGSRAIFVSCRTVCRQLDSIRKFASDFDLPRIRAASRKDFILNWSRVLTVFTLSLPAFGQYAGPAILLRGEAPAAMATPEISFRPFLELTGTYNTGLASPGVTDTGELANARSWGTELAWGVSGTHSWRHTKLGLDYRGSLDHYIEQTRYDGINESLLLGITQQFTRHVLFTLRESGGIFNRDFGLVGLSQTVPFDPSASYVPTTDFFNNRTLYTTTQADLTFQKSVRLSFDIGGNGSIVSRRSGALYGVVGAGAHGDVQYRLTRTTTVGADYQYLHLDFTRVFGGTDIHGVSFSYAVALSRTLEFSGYAGAMRVESKFLQTAPVDPVIAALLGITQAIQVSHHIDYVPNASGRLTKTYKNGVAYVSGGHTVTPGNGLFLTSYATTVFGGYTYTGLRRWSFSAGAGYSRMKSAGNVDGVYGGKTASMSVSRQIGRYTHVILNYSLRQYDSPDFSKYNRLIHTASVGIGFTPGDVPLRIW